MQHIHPENLIIIDIETASENASFDGIAPDLVALARRTFTRGMFAATPRSAGIVRACVVVVARGAVGEEVVGDAGHAVACVGGAWVAVVAGRSVRLGCHIALNHVPALVTGRQKYTWTHAVVAR